MERQKSKAAKWTGPAMLAPVVSRRLLGGHLFYEGFVKNANLLPHAGERVRNDPVARLWRA